MRPTHTVQSSLKGAVWVPLGRPAIPQRSQASCTRKHFGFLRIPWALSCSVHIGPAPEVTVSLKGGHLCGAFSHIKLTIVNPCLFVTFQLLHQGVWEARLSSAKL